MGNKKILILGAGLAGLSASFHLKQRGLEAEVLEKEAEAGGLCRSKNVGRFSFDYTGHLLHFRSAYASGLVRGLLGDTLVAHRRRAAIFTRRVFVPYPFQCNLSALPPRVLKECFTGFIRARGCSRGAEEPDFLSWIRASFGDGIAKHFMVPYNTKFWTVPPQRMTCEWLDGFVPVPTLDQMIDGAVGSRHRPYGYNARFWYPREGGIQQLPRALEQRGFPVRTRMELTSIDLRRKFVRAGGRREKFDMIISSIPLPDLPGLIPAMPGEISREIGKLRWNSVSVLNLGIARPMAADNHWVYYPDGAYPFFRVGFYHAVSSALVPPGGSSLYAEVSRPGGASARTTEVRQRIKQGLVRCGILRSPGEIQVEDFNDIEYAYPLYDHNYSRAVSRITEYLKANGIIPVGRYGRWKYMSMEDSLLDGCAAARRIAAG